MVLRVVTGVLAGLIALAAALAGSVWWVGFVLALLAVASAEWAKMGDVSRVLLLVTMVGGGALVIFKQWIFLPVLIVLPAIPLLYYQDPARGRDAVWSAAGVFWLSIPAGLIVFVRQEYGLVALTVLMVGTILQDSLAFYSGYIFGGNTPFTPNLSPNKTWAGFFGGLVGMVGTLLVGGIYMQWPLFVSLPVGLVMGIVGQAGDLSISALKRRMDIEDTGSIIPGHGGILDRADALLFNVAIFFPICRIVELYDLTIVYELNLPGMVS
jgi:phosphatidate cytidylyltransferase